MCRIFVHAYYVVSIYVFFLIFPPIYSLDRRRVPIFPFVEHRGMTFLAMTGEVDIEKRFQQVKDFDSKATDIILCSAMKTGNLERMTCAGETATGISKTCIKLGILVKRTSVFYQRFVE